MDDIYVCDVDVVVNQQQYLLDSYRVHGLPLDEKCNAIDTRLVQTDLQKLKLKFTQLKHVLRDQRSRLYMLQAVGGGEGQLEGDTTESGLKESTKKVQSLKEDLQDCRIRFVELADQGEKYHSEYHSMHSPLSKLREKLAEIQTTRERINEKKRDLSDKLELLGANQRNEKMEKAKRDLVLLSGAVDEVEQTVSRLLEFSNDEFIECDSVVEGLQSDTGRVESYLAWCDDVAALLRQVSGVVVETADIGALVLRLDDDDGGASLRLDVHYTRTRLGGYRLASAEVCCDALACDPAVAATLAAAVAASDLTLLVSGVRDAWRQRRATIAELDRLRARFSIDWLESTRQIRVLFGKRRDILVTLQLTAVGRGGGATLLRVEGLSDEHDTALGAFKGDSETRSVTEWLDLLEYALRDQ